ncbi:MAG: hypothetical protein QW568_03300 [Candidatus Anstonellaceae archaeon]
MLVFQFNSPNISKKEFMQQLDAHEFDRVRSGFSKSEQLGYAMLSKARQDDLASTYFLLRTKYRQSENDAAFWIRTFLDHKTVGGVQRENVADKFDLNAKDMEAMLQLAWSLERRSTFRKGKAGDRLYEHFQNAINGYGNGKISVMRYLATSLGSYVDEGTATTRERQEQQRYFIALRKTADKIFDDFSPFLLQKIKKYADWF